MPQNHSERRDAAYVGKFDSAVDEAVYGLSLDGGADDEVGSSSESPGTWAGLMRDGAELAIAIERDRGNYPNVTEADLKFLRKEGVAGAIMLEETSGLVSVKYYRDKVDLNRDWAECEKELSLPDDDEGHEPNARGRRGGRRQRKNSSIADRRRAGTVEGLTKEELDSLTLEMPTFDWKQIGGDMNPGSSGGIIATANGQTIELIEIQPVREHVGDREAAEVGHPFWSKEGYYDLDDLDPKKPGVQSAIEYAGLGEHLLDMTPEVRTIAIAEACLQAGHGSDEGPGGWAKDVVGDRQVEWMAEPGKKQGWEYIADEDTEFKREVLGQNFVVMVDGTEEARFDDEEEAIADAKEYEGSVEVVDEESDEIVWPEQVEVGDLHNYKTGDYIREATEEETIESIETAKNDGGAGVIIVDGEGCYVEGGSAGERKQRPNARVRPSRHQANPPMPELERSGVLSSLIDMEAESMEPRGSGRVPREVKNELEVTPELREVTSEYEAALESALEEVVRRWPPEDGASAAALFADDAPYLVLMTLRGEGVGIWDGRWDSHYPGSDDTNAIGEFLKEKLGGDRGFASDAGSGRLTEELRNAVYDAMNRAGYRFDEHTYVPVDKATEVIGPRKNPGRGRAKSHRPNGTTARHVFLNGELIETVYYVASMDNDEVRRSLIDHDGYDPRIKVDQPPARRSALPAHYSSRRHSQRAPGGN